QSVEVDPQRRRRLVEARDGGNSSLVECTERRSCGPHEVLLGKCRENPHPATSGLDKALALEYGERRFGARREEATCGARTSGSVRAGAASSIAIGSRPAPAQRFRRS